MSTATVNSIYSGHKKLYFKEAFYFATLGGAETLGLGDTIGNFVPGKEFDALVIDPYATGSPFDVFQGSTAEIFEKFIFLGDDRNISQIYVKGKQVLNS